MKGIPSFVLHQWISGKDTVKTYPTMICIGLRST